MCWDGYFLLVKSTQFTVSPPPLVPSWLWETRSDVFIHTEQFSNIDIFIVHNSAIRRISSRDKMTLVSRLSYHTATRLREETSDTGQSRV